MVGWELVYGNTDVIYRLEGIFLVIIGGMGLFQVTRNYLRRTAVSDSECEPPAQN